ncbi:hypothetical protein [Nautilia lithotrophica]
MKSEEKILKHLLETENISIKYKLKALEALKIDNVFDLKEFVKNNNINVDIDIAQDLEENKEKVYYELIEEFYRLRDNNCDFKN